jgi:hypothetical protein
MEPGPNGFRELRSAHTDPNGSFVIHSLRPGTRYVLSAWKEPDIFTDQVAYLRYEDTLEFTAGEDRFAEIAMERLWPC